MNHGVKKVLNSWNFATEIPRDKINNLGCSCLFKERFPYKVNPLLVINGVISPINGLRTGYSPI